MLRHINLSWLQKKCVETFQTHFSLIRISKPALMQTKTNVLKDEDKDYSLFCASHYVSSFKKKKFLFFPSAKHHLIKWVCFSSDAKAVPLEKCVGGRKKSAKQK